VRLATNVEAALGNTGRELFCQTVNLSSTGMLIRTQHRPPLGTPVVFKITFPEKFGTINGRGEIIRHASIGHGGVDGVAIRFSSFANDGADMLQNYMEAMTSEQEPDPLTEIVQPQSNDPQAAPKKIPNAQRVRRKKTSNPVILEFE
jgi:hypothetical protein